MCGNKFQTLKQLRDTINANAQTIRLHQVENVIDSFVKRSIARLARNRHHIEYTL